MQTHDPDVVEAVGGVKALPGQEAIHYVIGTADPTGIVVPLQTQTDPETVDPEGQQSDPVDVNPVAH